MTVGYPLQVHRLSRNGTCTATPVMHVGCGSQAKSKRSLNVKSSRPIDAQVADVSAAHRFGQDSFRMSASMLHFCDVMLVFRFELLGS
jgi:hypothetical protein